MVTRGPRPRLSPTMELTLAAAALPAPGSSWGFSPVMAGLTPRPSWPALRAALTAICGWMAAGCCARAGRLRGRPGAWGAPHSFPGWPAGRWCGRRGSIRPPARSSSGRVGWSVAYLPLGRLPEWPPLALWLHTVPPAPPMPPGARAPCASRWRCPGGPPARLGWLAVPLLALAAVAYWNGAILDPLQYRGFPDYVTQLGAPAGCSPASSPMTRSSASGQT